ncbi:MAG TPA: transposase [Stellaceae bacterium]|nr:transposase [Stellaceae bacterium]
MHLVSFGGEMARRPIGQEQLRLLASTSDQGSALDQIARLIDWTAIGRQLAGIYAAAKGELGRPPLALFRALLLGIWHDLSDVKLAEALDDRASFRRFCGFVAGERTPERTAFVRFRAELVRRGPDRVLFAAITAQLQAKGVAVRTGTLMDATVIAARGGRPRIAHNGMWDGAQALARLRQHNATVRRVRGRIEMVFGTCKRR